MEVLERLEASPATYPPAPTMRFAPTQSEIARTWARIENWIAHRWTPRSVVWVVAGPGTFEADLAPCSFSTVEVWEPYSWATVTLNPSPLGGYELPGAGPYRFSATVGDVSPADPPVEVKEAFRRLAEYSNEAASRSGVGRYSVRLGELEESFDRSPKWLAQAMHLSGAADLLRNYRKAPGC